MISLLLLATAEVACPARSFVCTGGAPGNAKLAGLDCCCEYGLQVVAGACVAQDLALAEAEEIGSCSDSGMFGKKCATNKDCDYGAGDIGCFCSGGTCAHLYPV